MSVWLCVCVCVCVVCVRVWKGGIEVHHTPDYYNKFDEKHIKINMPNTFLFTFILEECTCPDESCIMAETVKFPYATRWSNCSIYDLNIFYKYGDDSCLFDMPTPITQSQVICGDGIVEGNEACDCGSPEKCTNKCCDPTTCQFTAGAECAIGACCNSQCQIKAYGTECRASSGECDIPEYCLGDSNVCPEDRHVVNGESCASGTGYCVEGSCPTHEDQCQAVFGEQIACDHDHNVWCT